MTTFHLSRFLSAMLFVAGGLVAGTTSAWAQQEHPSNAYAADTPIHVMPVQGKVYMIVVGGADGVNITAQVGDQGIFLVDAGPAALGDKLVQTLRQHFGNKPVRYLVNTHVHPDHVDGNAAIVQAYGRDNTTYANPAGAVRIISHINAMNRLDGSEGSEDVIAENARPVMAFSSPTKELFLNGEPVVVYSRPGAHTDGDLMVWFRGSDVISAGDAFVMGNFPVIDAKRGGTLQGLIATAEQIIDITVPERNVEGGTRIIPGHGRLCNEVEVTDYLVMLGTIRDRVADMVKEGKTLEQIKAAKVTLDYDHAVYNGKQKAFWTPEMFLEAVYHDVSNDAELLKSR